MFFVWSVTKSYLTDFWREHCAWEMVGMAANGRRCLWLNKSVPENENFLMKLVIFDLASFHCKNLHESLNFCQTLLSSSKFVLATRLLKKILIQSLSDISMQMNSRHRNHPPYKQPHQLIFWPEKNRFPSFMFTHFNNLPNIWWAKLTTQLIIDAPFDGDSKKKADHKMRRKIGSIHNRVDFWNALEH